MSLRYEVPSIITTEFGFGRETNGTRSFGYVPTEIRVQDALKSMLRDTLTGMEGSPEQYDPSEKYGSREYLYVRTNNPLVDTLRHLHTATNIDEDVKGVRDPGEIFGYFARFTNSQRKKVTAVKRAAQFKAVLGKRLIRFDQDNLQLLEDKVFKLDNDFDFVISDDTIHVVRPSGLEFIAQMQTALMAGAETVLDELSGHLDFVEFANIKDYAAQHPKAARLLTSIKARGEMKNVDKGRLKSLCKKTGIELKTRRGKFHVDEKQIIGFLEVLDRRRYEVELVRGTPEAYRAPSRKKLND